MPGSAHGVRKIAATRAANAGATVAQLEAIFGWQGGTMASLYTRAADRRWLAMEAMHKLSVDRKKTRPPTEPTYPTRDAGVANLEYTRSAVRPHARRNGDIGRQANRLCMKFHYN